MTINRVPRLSLKMKSHCQFNCLLGVGAGVAYQELEFWCDPFHNQRESIA